MHPATPPPGNHPPDPLFASVDGLVRDGTLSPDQATRVYNTMRHSAGDTTMLPTTTSGRWSRPDIRVVTAAVLLLGGGLVLSGGVVAEILAAGRGDFSWKRYAVVIATTLALLAAAAAVELLVRGADERHRLASALGALGALGAGFCVDAAFTDHGGAGYLAGLLMLVLSAAGYYWLRGSALAASAVLGGLVLLAAALSDGPDSLGSGIGSCVVLVLYAAAVVAAGWMFPCRNVTGVLGGVIALYGVFVGIFSAGVASLVVFGPTGLNDNDGDVAVAMVIGLLVVAALLGLYAITGYAGYAILGVVGAVLIPAASLFAFRSGSALRWGAVVAAVGVALMAGSVAVWRNRQFPHPSRPGPGTS